MKLEIRHFTRADLPGIIDLWNVVRPNQQRTLDEAESDIDTLAPEFQTEFFVTELEGAIVGVAEIYRHPGMYHPHKFFGNIFVHPDHQKKGIGSALYQQSLEFLTALEAICFCTQVAEFDTHSIQFATTRGFTESKRDFESLLTVKNFDFGKFAGLENVEGVEFHTAKELDSTVFRKAFYDTWMATRGDVPRSQAASPISFEFFQEQVLGDEYFLWEGTQIALDPKTDQILGFSGVYHGAREGWLDQWLTATRREARGRGIALALKLRVIKFALEKQYTIIRTDNDTRNAPMLAINDKLGFVRQPALISVVKFYRDDE
jgi:GNAT superfamily N-acetyltransferase